MIDPDVLSYRVYQLTAFQSEFSSSDGDESVEIGRGSGKSEGL